MATWLLLPFYRTGATIDELQSDVPVVDHIPMPLGLHPTL